jgi:acetolactate synthase I/II/III large subunit
MKQWMTGGEALVRSLRAHGVGVVFGVPGVQIYGTMAALRDEPGIRFLTLRHEQAASFMADGYARAGGDVGVGLVVPGPGLLNAASGLSTAYASSSPVLMISGQIPAASIGRGIGLLHEVVDQHDAIAPLTKWRRRVVEIEAVPDAVREAFRQLCTGRPRPVEIELPPETMEDEAQVALVEPASVTRQAAPAADIDRAAELLLGARRPLLYAGGGVVLGDAGAALRGVAAHLQAGIVTSAEGKGAVDERDDLSLGVSMWPGSALHQYVGAADAVLAVGTRLQHVGFADGTALIHLDVDPEEIGRHRPVRVGLAGDARLTLEQLLARLRAAGPARPSAAGEREALRQATAEEEADIEPQTSITRSLRAGTPEDAIFIAGMTQIGYFARGHWTVRHPRTYLTSSYSGNLGFEYPTALGAKVARPDRAVVAVIGDGGFLYNASELATAVRYGINVVAVVFNDGAYGNVARDMDETWGGAFGADLLNPDLMKLADAYGMTAMRAKEPTDVGRLVADAIQLDRPVLVEVPVGRMPKPHAFSGARRPRRRGVAATGE